MFLFNKVIKKPTTNETYVIINEFMRTILIWVSNEEEPIKHELDQVESREWLELYWEILYCRMYFHADKLPMAEGIRQ
jgi:hypothetical protein